MDPDAPGLFELDVDVPDRPARQPSITASRGRRREKWKVTVTATVVVLDSEAVNDAFAEQEEAAYALAELAESGDGEPAELSAMGKVAWLVWPTEGLDQAIDADAFQTYSVEAELLDDAGDRGTLRWSVTVKLHDVDALRCLAVDASPGDAEQIAQSFSVAWQHAIDPYAPIRVVPGIEWQPGAVDVAHVPARSSRTS